MSNALLIQNIAHVVTCDGQDRVLSNVDLRIENGVITHIGPNAPTAQRIIDGKGMVMYPGLINTHHHLYQYFSRNLPQVQNMELFPWLKTLYEIWKNLDEEVVYQSALCAMGELAKSGCTTCLDHQYVFPQGHSEDLLGHQFRAAQDLGLRFHATRGSMDLSVKDGGLPPDSVVQSIDEILKDSQRAVSQYHDASPFSMAQVALAPCSPFSVSGDLLRESALLARELGVRLHTHLAETKDEERYTMERFGLRPLAYMESLGWLGQDVWYAHGIHFNDAELALLAQTGTGVAHCPISNMKLSSGVARVPEMLRLGVNVGLAVDGSASNDGSNLLEELRVGFLLHRLASSTQAPSGYDMLKIATGGSARILGRQNQLGQLSVGYGGDLFMVDLNQMDLVGADLDVKSMLGTVGYKGAVAYTVVAGKVVVEHGELVHVDQEKITAQAKETLHRYLKGCAHG